MATKKKSANKKTPRKTGNRSKGKSTTRVYERAVYSKAKEEPEEELEREVIDKLRLDEPKTYNEILSDPATSDWLKDAIKSIDNRDPCDAAGDCAILLSIACARLSISLKQGIVDLTEPAENITVN